MYFYDDRDEDEEEPMLPPEADDEEEDQSPEGGDEGDGGGEDIQPSKDSVDVADKMQHHFEDKGDSKEEAKESSDAHAPEGGDRPDGINKPDGHAKPDGASAPGGNPVGNANPGASQAPSAGGGGGGSAANIAREAIQGTANGGLEEGAKKALSQAAKEEAKKQIAKMGGEAFMNSLSAAIAPVLFWIAVIVLVIIIVVGLVMFFIATPGQVVGKAKELGNNIMKAWSGMIHGQDKVVSTSQIASVADYVESMGYDLKGEGFITIDKTDEDISQTINDIKSWTSKDYNPDLADADLNGLLKLDPVQGVIRRNDTEEIVDLNSEPILTYIISDNQCYMIKNFNTNLDDMTGGNGDAWGTAIAVVSALIAIGVALAIMIVPGGAIVSSMIIGAAAGGAFAGVSFLAVVTGSNPNWGSGLISIYHEASMGRRDKPYDVKEKGDIDLDPETKKLSIKRGWANGTYTFDVDGWSGRYGMPLEFLLSVHLATQMPDLAIDIATTFDTDVEVLLHEVNGELTAGFLKEGHTPSSDSDFITYPEVSEIGKKERGLLAAAWEGILDFANFIAGVFTGGGEIWTDEELEQLAFTDRALGELFELGMPHSVNCTCCSHIYGHKSVLEEGEEECEGDEDAVYKDNGDVADDHVFCNDCRERAMKLIAAIKVCNDKKWESYTPYISKVENHWFRDVYFVMNDSEGERSKGVVKVDEDYFYETEERWTMYEVWEEGESIPEGFEAGDYKLYDPDNMSTPSSKTKAEVQEINEKIANGDTTVTRLVKKAITDKMDGNFDDGWSAYTLTDAETGDDLPWTQIGVDKNSKGELLEPAVYKDEDAGNAENILIYYKEIRPGDVKQIEDGQRTETNETIKEMFLTRKYYKYDGSTTRADAILKDKQQTDVSTYNKAGDNRDKKLIAKVNINKDSLGAFSILENTHTLDADYIYRDFKELIVELNYFDKEDLSNKIADVMQWPIPACGSAGWPVRQYEKGETFYGTLINSKVDLELLRKNNEEIMKSIAPSISDEDASAIQADIAAAEQEQLNIEDPNLPTTPGINGMNLTGSVSSTLALKPSAGIKNDVLVAGLTGNPVDIHSSDKNGAQYEITINGVTYTRYYQAGQSYSSNTFTWSGQTKTIGGAACGPTSMVNILTGYGYDYNPEDDITGLVFNATCTGLGELYEKWTDGGTSQVYSSDFEQHITEAFEAGKPCIVLATAAKGGDSFWTDGGHFIACLGVDESGNLITADPAGNWGSEDFRWKRMVYPEGIAGISKYLTGMWVPDEAPTGVSMQPFVGYEPEQDVVSPVTGRIVEYGQVERKNEETGEKEEVDFIKIQALDHYITSAEGKAVTEQCTDEKMTYEENSSDTEKKEGYDYFYEEYKGIIDSCVLYIEGFDLTLDETLASTDMEAPEVTQYKGNQVYNMTDNVKEAQSLWREDAKAAALPFFKDGDDIYIKEGTVIGKTSADPEGYETVEGTDANGNATTTTPAGNGNYMRLILRDIEDSIMEDVETYIRTDKLKSSENDWELFFWLPFESGGVNVTETGSGRYTGTCSVSSCSTGEVAIGIIQWTSLTSPPHKKELCGQQNFVNYMKEHYPEFYSILSFMDGKGPEYYWEDYNGGNAVQEALHKCYELDEDLFLEAQMEAAKEQYLNPLLESYSWLAERPKCVQGAIMHLRVWGAKLEEGDKLSDKQGATDEQLLEYVRNKIANTGSTAKPADGNTEAGRAWNEPEIGKAILDGRLSGDNVEQWVRTGDTSIVKGAGVDYR